MLNSEEFQLILLLNWSKSLTALTHPVNLIRRENVYTRKDGTQHVWEIDLFLLSVFLWFLTEPLV